jgi:hypothetical protein
LEKIKLSDHGTMVVYGRKCVKSYGVYVVSNENVSITFDESSKVERGVMQIAA